MKKRAGRIRHVPPGKSTDTSNRRGNGSARYPRELSGAGSCSVSAWPVPLFEGTQFLLAEMSTMLDVITQAQIWNPGAEEVEQRQLGLLMVKP